MLTTSWSRPASRRPAAIAVIEQQRVRRHLGAQAALLGGADHVQEARMQERLAQPHEGDRAAGLDALGHGLERRPLHEALGLVPGVPHAGSARQVAGVGGLQVDLAGAALG